MKLDRISLSDQEMQYRVTYYFMLSKLLAAPPTSETLHSVSMMSIPESEAINNFLVTLNSLARAARNSPDLSKLDDEYHDLFIGVGRGELVPYGSWYITGMVLDKPLSVLRQDLKALGIERIQDNREPEDHVSALMDTMGIIIQAGDEFQFKTQQTMFSRHLKPWIRRFFKDLCVAKKADFYKEVGKFGVEFVNFETEYLEMPN